MAGSPHHPRQPAVTRFFLFFIMSFFASQVVSDCYFPNGNQAVGMSECRKNGKGTGICCYDGDSCINQICSHGTGHEDKLYRGGCTSKAWLKDDVCPDICTGKDNLLGSFESLSPCSQKDSYWCGSYGEEEDGCDPKHRVVLKGPLDPFDTAEPSSASKTSTSSSKAATVSVTSGTSIEITTRPPSEAPTDGPLVPPTDSNISPSTTSTDPGAPTSTEAPGEVDDGHVIPIAVGIAVGTLITVASSALLFFYIRKKRKERPRRAESPPPHHFTNF